MDNHNPTEREKERVKILIEELKILQGVINRMAQNSLECKKWTLALAVGVLSLKIEAISHLYGLCVLGVLLAWFYLLDDYYLMLERLFRERLFEVFPAHQTCRFALHLCTMLSFSLFPYWALGLCLVVYGFVSNSVSMECWL
ncbi:hypothetical protein [Helicobacter pylori]|uniref:hypothetical protein n=1 Tax=Helicobacter pylori TaxID=210 RepID=UPI0018F27705|nr:hypothetical protein [Helicobacter pylori]